MKFMTVIVLSLGLSGCALFGSSHKVTAEKVPSCFGDGDNQATHCKIKQTRDDGRISTIRCIGAQNQSALPSLRGKCAEKICSDGSNTDCEIRGDIAVLDQYTELITAKLFADENHTGEEPKRSEMKVTKPTGPKDVKDLAKENNKVAAKTAVKASEKEANEVPNATLSRTSMASAALPAAAKKPSLKETGAQARRDAVDSEDDASSSMQLVLRPAKGSPRAPASVGHDKKGFKRVCVASNEMEAPKNLRGKCATRQCSKGRCTYQGRKEMFDWIATQSEM